MTGAVRIARHLWRMSFALFIAALSFFLGQADELPRAWRIPQLLVIPPLAVLVTMIYWMWRVRLRRSLRGLVVPNAAPGSAAVTATVGATWRERWVRSGDRVSPQRQ